jgi:prophage regulatory protein
MKHEAISAAEPNRLLRISQVIELAGIGKTMIYRLMRAGEFPQPYKPGGYSSRWSEAEVLAWRETQRKAA